MTEQLTQEQIAAYAETWADALCECAGEDKTFAEQFKKDCADIGLYNLSIFDKPVAEMGDTIDKIKER